MDGPFVKNLTHLSKRMWSRQKYCLIDNSVFIKHIKQLILRLSNQFSSIHSG